MNLPRAFYTRRVAEALNSLATHVISAQNIAASLNPIKTPSHDLQPEEEPRPIIESISPENVNTRNFDGKFTISGKNLIEGSVKSFALILNKNPSVLLETNSISPTKEGNVVTGFEITFRDLSDVQSGSYEVRITDKNGERDFPWF